MTNSPANRSGQPPAGPGRATPDQDDRDAIEGLLGEISRRDPPRLSFARYTELAMSHPRWGYYQRRQQIFGRDGDFTTAPEMSSVFARALARKWREWAQSPERKNRPFEILELGPGTGRMALDLLRELERIGSLPSRYMLYEPSPALVSVQRLQLADLAEQLPQTRIEWLDSLDDVRIEGILVANELVDALPVEIARRQAGRIEYLNACCPPGSANLAEEWREAPASLAGEVGSLEQRIGRVFEDGYRIDLHISYDAWLLAVAGCLEEGQLWIADYGYDEKQYYHPQRSQGSVQSQYRHQRTDNPLAMPGLQDISASVNFDRLYRAAGRRGLSLVDYRPQGRWLVESGAAEIVQEDLGRESGPLERHRLRERFLQLVMPEAMGEVFKIAVFSTVAR